jgi:bis(5'-nucleosyl)-tetraphosphatase (symmetrical)
MAVFAIGDVQGCCDELQALIDTINFDPATDQLWFVGDLVNRGPKSLETLRFIRTLGPAAVCVLGNHDLHLLALAANPSTPTPVTYLQPILEAADRDDLLDWLRHKPLAHFDAELNTLMVHAGVHQNWNVQQTLQLAHEVEQVLASPQAAGFLRAMYGSKPTLWSDQLEGMDRLRFITNCLTRIRYCTAAGELEFKEKLPPGTQPEHLLPWFDIPQRASSDTRIVFGHWSTLGLVMRPDIIAVDTGCVWGGELTAVRLDEERPPVQVSSGQAARCGS